MIITLYYSDYSEIIQIWVIACSSEEQLTKIFQQKGYGDPLVLLSRYWDEGRCIDNTIVMLIGKIVLLDKTMAVRQYLFYNWNIENKKQKKTHKQISTVHFVVVCVCQQSWVDI